ncbi:hypothetical protein LR48_Vigan464s002200 [Vigna angularis]|uniref:Uncharacterized protein n=1 Tax=Phaseolus angularis TaxID=3914 RepID=A0A0L9TB38_PHAAN|nr:hypothetical protein LR48_Vigan464s002200 [Vigna angularis]
MSERNTASVGRMDRVPLPLPRRCREPPPPRPVRRLDRNFHLTCQCVASGVKSMQWLLVVAVGGGCWRWLLAVAIGGGYWRWLLAVAIGGEKSQIYRSAGPTSTPKDPSSIPNVHNKFQKLTRNVSKADASSWIRAWGSVVRNLTQLYPISQLPERETSLLLRATSSPRLVLGAVVAPLLP